MKALILASGEGRRLRPLTNNIPKSLVKINEEAIIDLQIKNLIECGIKDVVITTGSFENKIIEHMKIYPHLNVSYVNNPKYDTTNYIYSMWLTKELIDDDIILFHGDLLFNGKLLRMLINEEHANCVLINREVKPPEKDFKAIVENGRVTKIGVEFYGKNALFSVPLYKFSKSDFLYWLDEIEKFIKRGDFKIYAETVFNEISHEIILHPIYFRKEFCMEIDTQEDLEIAKKSDQEK